MNVFRVIGASLVCLLFTACESSYNSCQDIKHRHEVTVANQPKQERAFTTCMQLAKHEHDDMDKDTIQQCRSYAQNVYHTYHQDQSFASCE